MHFFPPEMRSEDLGSATAEREKLKFKLIRKYREPLREAGRFRQLLLHAKIQLEMYLIRVHRLYARSDKSYESEP